jgi:NTE family protein
VAWWYSALYGNPKFFSPIWSKSHGWNNWINYYFPYLSPHLYELDVLKRTLADYIDFKRLSNKQNIPRLIVTCTDVRDSNPVVFDSNKLDVNADHIVACASYPFYGISWTEIEGKYLWDGSLRSNTPLVEVIDLSPRRDKKVYIVNLFPHRQEQLPENFMDVWHRARDIIYIDKTDRNVKMSKVISKYLLLLKEMHDIISNSNLDDETKKKFAKINEEYSKIAVQRGAIISDIIKVERSESVHFLFEDADFSVATIKNLIKQGEDDAERALEENQRKKEKKSKKNKESDTQIHNEIS